MKEDEINRAINKISTNNSMNFLKSDSLYREYDCLRIASYILNIESEVKKGTDFESVTLSISEDTENSCDIDNLSKTINEIFRFILVKDIEINFHIEKRKKKSKKYDIPQGNYDYITLFSGGVDSLSGFLVTKEKHSLFPVSVIHGDQPKGSRIIKNLINAISELYNERISHQILYAPKMYRMGYSQVRGLLYSLYGTIFCNIFKVKNLLISEIGPTMYQPKFAPYDTITMTTHPYVTQKAKKLSKAIFNEDFDFITPYEDLTKAEAISISPKKGLFKKSNSCITLAREESEGNCYGCLIRRLGFITAGVEDIEYLKNVLIDEKVNADMILSLLRFNSDFLTDYEKIDYASRDLIEEYQKKDLFERFALDNFAALYHLKKQDIHVNTRIDKIYNHTIDSIGIETLQNRLMAVRENPPNPNFGKRVAFEI